MTAKQAHKIALAVLMQTILLEIEEEAKKGNFHLLTTTKSNQQSNMVMDLLNQQGFEARKGISSDKMLHIYW